MSNKDIICSIIYIIINFGIYNINAQSNDNLALFNILSVIIGGVLILLCFYCGKKNYALGKCFVPVALVCAVMFMLTTPVFRGADEELHFYRAYEISQGHLVSDIRNGLGGRELPSSLKAVSPQNTLDFGFDDLKEKIVIPLEKDKTEFIPFTTASLYSPVQYIPQTVGILIGRLAGLNPVYIAYLGRLFNFVIWLILSLIALKNLKNMPLIYLISLFPMSLHLTTTLSPDAITNALCLLFISYVVRLSYFEKDKGIVGKELFLIFITALAISLCKIVYLPICLLVFILPQTKFSDRKRHIIYCSALFFCCVFVNLIWLGVSFKYLAEVKDGVNAGKQVLHIITNPIKFVFVILYTTSKYFNMYIHSMVGANLCLFDVPVFYWVSNAYLLMLIFIASFCNTMQAKRIDRLLAVFVFTAVFVLINTCLYIQWNPVGSSEIDGMQGRYFLPLLPLLIFAFRRHNEKSINKKLVISTIFLTYPVILSLLLKHI